MKTVTVASGVSLTLAEEKYFTWKIENFRGIKNSPDRNLIKQQSFTFTAGESVGLPTKWECRLQENPERKVIGVYLVLQSQTDQKQVCVSYQFKKIKSNGKIGNVATGTYRWFSLPRDESAWGFSSFIFKDEDSLKDLIWKDGSIVIEVGFKLYAMQCKKMDLIEQVKIFEKKEVQNLSLDMTKMLLENKDQVGEDERGTIKLVAKDRTEFNVNLAILNARSPVFKAMFTAGNWKEGQHCGGGGSLVFEDLSGKTLNVLLHYLYGGGLLEDDWKAEDVIVELTWAAQKYQLDGLSEFLDKVLAELPIESKEVMGKLALLAKRFGMKNAEKELLVKLKKEAVDIDQLVLDKEGNLLGEVKGKGQRSYCSIM